MKIVSSIVHAKRIKEGNRQEKAYTEQFWLKIVYARNCGVKFYQRSSRMTQTLRNGGGLIGKSKSPQIAVQLNNGHTKNVKCQSTVTENLTFVISTFRYSGGG
jgi:hypothetical protein